MLSISQAQIRIALHQVLAQILAVFDSFLDRKIRELSENSNIKESWQGFL